MVLTWNCRAAIQCTVSTTFPQHRDSSLDTCRYTDNDVRLNGKIYCGDRTSHSYAYGCLLLSRRLTPTPLPQ
jgi:hypothetical protein